MSKDPNNRVSGPHTIISANGIWALEPYYLGPWTLRVCFRPEIRQSKPQPQPNLSEPRVPIPMQAFQCRAVLQLIPGILTENLKQSPEFRPQIHQKQIRVRNSQSLNDKPLNLSESPRLQRLLACKGLVVLLQQSQGRPGDPVLRPLTWRVRGTYPKP